MQKTVVSYNWSFPLKSVYSYAWQLGQRCVKNDCVFDGIQIDGMSKQFTSKPWL